MLTHRNRVTHRRCKLESIIAPNIGLSQVPTMNQCSDTFVALGRDVLNKTSANVCQDPPSCLEMNVPYVFSTFTTKFNKLSAIFPTITTYTAIVMYPEIVKSINFQIIQSCGGNIVYFRMPISIK